MSSILGLAKPRVFKTFVLLVFESLDIFETFVLLVFGSLDFSRLSSSIYKVKFSHFKQVEKILISENALFTRKFCCFSFKSGNFWCQWAMYACAGIQFFRSLLRLGEVNLKSGTNYGFCYKVSMYLHFMRLQ